MANNSDLQELRDQVINTSAVLEGIMRSRKFSTDEKIDRAIERMCETIVSILKLKRARNDSSQK